MGTKPRSKGQTSTSISLEKDLLAAIDARAARLGLSRSQYLVKLAETDIEQRGPLIIQEKHGPPLVTPPQITPAGPVTYTKRMRKRRANNDPAHTSLPLLILCAFASFLFISSRHHGHAQAFDRAIALRQANAPDNFQWPHRRIAIPGRTNPPEGTVVDLRPWFTNSTFALRNSKFATAPTPPATTWKFLRGEIAQVHPYGLLLATFTYDADYNRRPQGTIGLTNYPGWRDLTDGKTLTFWAYPIGQITFRDHLHIQRTVTLYDHGTPYDPYSLAKSNTVASGRAQAPTNTARVETPK